MVGEKRITKAFEYDTPSELVITYLSEVKGADACLHSSVYRFPPPTQHGITCVGFHDLAERQRFIFHLDRVMKLHQDKAVRLRARVDSEARQLQKPTEYVPLSIKQFYWRQK